MAKTIKTKTIDPSGCGAYNGSLHVTLHGMVSVGPKGQVVIPASARKEVGIAPGDHMLVVVKLGKAIVFVKANQLEELHKALSDEIKEWKKK